MASEYTTVSITLPAREDLRRFSAISGGSIGQRITMADALRIAVWIANEHQSEVTNAAVALGLIEPPAKEARKK